MLELNNQVLAGLAVAAVLIFICLGLAIYLKWHKERRLKMFDNMEGREFEFYCAELLKKNGFYDVKVTRASGDYGIDILAEKDGVTYGIQCKRYSGLVGIKAVQEAYSGKEYYDRMVGAVLTNQYFTKPAMTCARKLKILMWDGAYLEEMME